ncbi:TlpA family protein disulfide reductase [Nocardioides dongxiaopingii]|uniref:TlpA disulfide reductase family protein n=1 Tax=Nocardioides sp. S-1144 TaxID=2582905 RepID=UPI00110DBAAF|nr:TlpA disulfide reductase family protein [Nocardioides sp. S-1144]QCW49324.1 TlpA family protein disulfide reductase [Nocardioides sp. S-1144]
MQTSPPSIRDWTVSRWFNTDHTGFSTHDLDGRVVLAAAFQMLCPACVEHTVPQLRKAAALFPAEQVAVVGLHTVFEHHDAMTSAALQAFLHEYRVHFPVAVDAPAIDGGAVPVTMARLSLQGTPTVMLYDRSGRLRRQTLGHLSDMQLGAEITRLGAEPAGPSLDPALAEPAAGPGCDDVGCRP